MPVAFEMDMGHQGGIEADACSMGGGGWCRCVGMGHQGRMEADAGCALCATHCMGGSCAVSFFNTIHEKFSSRVNLLIWLMISFIIDLRFLFSPDHLMLVKDSTLTVHLAVNHTVHPAVNHTVHPAVNHTVHPAVNH